MSTGEDEPSSGFNGRLRSRKSNILGSQSAKATRKLDSKPHDKFKRITPSKVTPSKPDDLTNKSDSPSPRNLCPYCDKIFHSKQTLSKHIRRTHLSASKQDYSINCLFCTHNEDDGNNIVRHMVDNHPNQYFACYDCFTRFPSTNELAEHKLNVCENQKLTYRNKLRQKTPKKGPNAQHIIGRNDLGNVVKSFSADHGFNRIVISCELRPSHLNDPADIEDNITTNLILPPSKTLGNATFIEKNAIIVLDDLQWNKRIPPNFSFHNTDADQILSRLGVVHKSPRASEFNKREWIKNIDDSNQKFEKCFDTSFYCKVASNVQENLTKFLDGTFNFNPDPENTIKTRKAKNSVSINTVEGFPILLTCEQFSRNIFDAYMPRAVAPKHKWKWENLENDKNLITPEQLKRDSHTNNCIITLVSSLDIWTQLCMRRKFEEKFNQTPIEKKTEKQTIIGKELKEILESRELPTSSQVLKYIEPSVSARESLDFPSSLGLVPTKPNYNLKPAVLSGEWVRPRCYVCCACGAQTYDSKALSSHISIHHPNAQIQHYEIVGEVLLNSDILKHLYVPPSQMHNRSRPLRGFRDCTKCNITITFDDLHQHMLDCAGDAPTVRRKIRHRPFGMRKRRPRLPDDTIRKKIRTDIRSRHTRKNRMRSRQKIRSEVGDAETIRKMLADLPAKRHRVLVNPLNPILRPRRKLNKQRNKLLMKNRMIVEFKKKKLINDFSHDNNTVSDDYKRGSSGHAEKRMVPKILRHDDDPFDNKPITNRHRTNGALTEENGNFTGCSPPSDGEGTMQNQQSPLQNNSDRVNLNDSSNNHQRQHGNNNNNNNNNNGNNSNNNSSSNNNNNNYNNNSGGSNSGSSNNSGVPSGSSNSGDPNRPNNGGNNNGRKNNQPPGRGGKNNESDRNGSKQSRDVPPLKHSIEKLTACSNTKDKSFQFHCSFLVNQNCNESTEKPTRHPPSEERMLFENEAIITKLDKPPLHFGYQEIMDAQMFNRNKLIRRKGLNDCIAMLRNKLVEPSLGTPPGHMSVQCGTDEPIAPEPGVIERRHSTTDSTFETAQRSLQMHYPNNTLEDNLRNYDTGSRVTRRSHSVRYEPYSSNIQAAHDYLQWKLYCERQIYAAHKNNEQYTNRPPSRRRSVVLPEDILMQHAANMNILTGQNMRGFPDYNYPNNITAMMPPKPPTRRTRSPRAGSGSKAAKEIPSRDPSIVNTPKTRRNCRRKVDTTPASAAPSATPPRVGVAPSATAPSATPTPTRSLSAKQIEHTNVHGNLITTENVALDYPPITMSDDRISVIERQVLPIHNIPDQQAYHNARLYQNPPIMRYPIPADVRPLHYNMHIKPTSINFSSKLPRVEDREPTVQYNREPQCCAVPYGNYESLNLSNRHSVQIHENESHVDSNDVLDLRVKNTSPTTNSPCLTPVPIDVVGDGVEDDMTDLSARPTRDDYYPTDICNRRSYTKVHSYENRGGQDPESRMNMIQGLSRPMVPVGPMRIPIPATLRNELVNEQPTDLSSKRHENSSNSSSTYCMPERQPLSICTDTTELKIEDIPADLLVRNNERRHRIYVDSQGTEYYQEILVNDETGSVHNVNDTEVPINCTDAGQMFRVHYNTSPRMNCSRSTITPYPERSKSIDDTQNISTSNLTSPTTTTCDRAECNEMAYRNSKIPLARAITDISEPRACSADQCNTIGSPIVYEPNQPNYIMTNSAQYRTVENLTPNSVHNTFTTPTVTGENRESVNTFQSSISPIPHQSQNEEGLPIKNSSLPLTIEIAKKTTETVQASKTTLDQDPETARKIAMLPKELVEILGNMPVDHRNQLLNVLPQYVSTSTSPVVPNNKAIKKSSSCKSPNVKSSIHINDDLVKELKTDITSDDGRLLLTNTMAMSPNTVSSSILLTPPTPQMPDRHLPQSYENADILSAKYLTESRSSDDGQSVRKTDTEKSKTVTNLTSSIENVVKMNEIDTKERMIDVTDDEFALENSEGCYNPDSLIHTIPLPNSVEPKAQKSNNGNTASLRAVRIKAPSERQRSILSETKPKPRHPDTSNPMAIQQDEISSTQNRTVVGTTQISPLAPSLKNNNSLRENVGKDTPPKSDTDIIYTMTEKQSIVTSSLLKDVDYNNVKNDATKEFCPESSKLPTQHLMDGSKTKAVLETSEGKSTIEYDDDSEDDVTLATIVKKKNQKFVAAIESNNVQLERKQKSKKTKKAEQINDHAVQQNQSESMNNADQPSVSETEMTIDSSEGLTKNKDPKIIEDPLNEKVNPKKKSKKGRRTNNVVGTKCMDRPENISQTITEREVDKENTVTSDIINSKETIEDPVKAKSSSESDSKQSNLMNKIAVNGMEMLGKKEKVKKSITFASDCNSTINQVIYTTPERPVFNQKEHETTINASNTQCNSTNATNEVLAIEEMDTINNADKLEVNGDSKMTKSLTENAPKIPDLNKLEDSVTSQKNMMKDDDRPTENPSDMSKISDSDDSDTTPLRRSRRGLSLYIDGTSLTLTNENLPKSESTREYKLPLTKKQLIFSKLLLDEENRLSKISSLEKQTDNPVPDTCNKSLLASDSNIEPESLQEDRKRRMSPQLNNDCKKQKSLVTVQSAEDTDVESSLKSVNVSVSEKSTNLTTENIVSTSYTAIDHKLDLLDNKGVEIDKSFVNRDPRLKASLSIEKANSIEKRKSGSPVKLNSVPCLKPKKSKPNNELTTTQSTSLVKISEKETKTVAINEDVTAIVASRNTPCYNKPAARRARSKSVFVKSSEADLYDPYDIDLEDMVDKTEPFFRKETSSKIKFNSYKSSITGKSKKSTKTAPSAIIDISPSSLADVSTTDAPTAKDECIKETRKSTSGFVNESVTNIKDSSSDSDESSKSDVPLKKYVEEKERKLLKAANKTKCQQEPKVSTFENEKRDKSCDKSKVRKKIGRSQSINNKEETELSKQETEKELRSEQFMESFGFFSERKPRKCNLLATKKISETFHIANESDDVFFAPKDKVCEKTTDSKKIENTKGKSSAIKKPAKRGRKKKRRLGPTFCNICRKTFRRFDNYIRHQVSLIHVTKFAQVKLNFKTVKIEEEPNYLIVYKQQLDRLKVLQNKIAKRKKNCLSTADIILPTLEQILDDVKRTIREQQLSRRGLSQDQELFIDCCAMLKQSTTEQLPISNRYSKCNSFNCQIICQEELAFLERSISDDKCDIKCDDVDAITAKNIFESEEVRNLENDLISNLKEANGLKGPYSNVYLKTSHEFNTVGQDAVNFSNRIKKIMARRQKKANEKMHQDVVESVDIFEDKFDKIKRKCRSQAAAAKQIQSQLTNNTSYKNRQKVVKKKVKRSPKKSQSTVPTKGALKGFDGFKVSISTSDINMSAIVSSVGNSFKKKMKSSPKGKKERQSSDLSSKCDSDTRSKETPQKKVDVYEFMDSEDTELFELRPSTLMERFKNISNKVTPSTSKAVVNQDDLAEASSESGSDGDDFVYMSDDYVCSEDETENSTFSCELSLKKTVSPLKRKDVIEKNAVMGKIFKHNAVRSDRKSPKRRETAKPKTNLDQLFDSLLQEEPKTSSLTKDNEDAPENEDATSPQTSNTQVSPKPDTNKPKSRSPSTYESKPETKIIPQENALPKTSNYPTTSSSSKKRKSITPPRKLDLSLFPTTIEYQLIDSNRKVIKKCVTRNERSHSSIQSDMAKENYDLSDDDHSADEDDGNTSPTGNHYQKNESKEKSHNEKEKSYVNEKETKKYEDAERVNPVDQTSEDAGVAPQRVRRKCTVGKQNVLAESWSSESEPDGVPQRPNSAESVFRGGRKKKNKKKDMPSSRRAGKQPKRPEAERVARTRVPYYWSDGEEEQEIPQQHGWIVGDSHKKLVTMLAHAKGRKRHDEKSNILE